MTRHPYAAFVETAQSLSIEADAPLKPASQFQYIGQETKRVDAIAKATGTAEFGIDVDVPDMHYAVIVRPPVARAKAQSVECGKCQGDAWRYPCFRNEHRRGGGGRDVLAGQAGRG